MIVALPPHGLSNAAAGRSKHWIKKLSGVNTKLTDGFAFEGDFVSFGGTVEVPEGTFFLSYIEYCRGSGRLDGRTVTLYQASNDALHVVKGWDLDGSAGWALHVRDEVATMMGAVASSTDSIIWMIDLEAGPRKDGKLPDVDGRPVTRCASTIDEANKLLADAGVIARGRRNGGPLPAIILMIDDTAPDVPVIDWHAKARLTGSSAETAEQHGYADRWARWDAANKLGEEIPDATEAHHSDQCAGSPEFVLGPDERWSARCDRDTLCDGVGDNRMWEITGCETLREAGARFFGGDDRRLYGVEV